MQIHECTQNYITSNNKLYDLEVIDAYQGRLRTLCGVIEQNLIPVCRCREGSLCPFLVVTVSRRPLLKCQYQAPREQPFKCLLEISSLFEDDVVLLKRVQLLLDRGSKPKYYLETQCLGGVSVCVYVPLTSLLWQQEARWCGYCFCWRITAIRIVNLSLYINSEKIDFHSVLRNRYTLACKID